MTKQIPVKNVNPREYKDYWKKAHDFLKTMGDAYLKQNWNSTGLEGIHAAISAADALLIFLKNQKSSSKRHLDAAELVGGLSVEGAQQAANHLVKILATKSLVEYSGDDYLPEDAEEVVKHVERFFNWVRGILPKE